MSDILDISRIKALQPQVEAIAKDAGLAIMDIYQRDFDVYTKQDESPLTDADLAAHNVIVAGLEPSVIYRFYLKNLRISLGLNAAHGRVIG